MTWTATTYELWHHPVTRERWVVRIEHDTLTGVFGPVQEARAPASPNDLPFEDHPDDLEWFVRCSESFQVQRLSG
jgi:hypothetical protein